jgi:hypothetical protein
MRRVAAAALLVTLCACEPEEREETTSFTTFLTRQEVRARAQGWLAERALYDVTSSDPTFVRGEKRRARTAGPGEQIDVQSVSIAEVTEGTRVEVHAQTYLAGPGDVRDQADELSPEALADHRALVDVLNPHPF